MTPVLSTYRLQLRPGFGLAAARSLLPYLDRLGVTHLYLSPILRARRGSEHGYDVVDPTSLNPELGDESELEALVAAARRREMGLVLDIVPNHMATGPENRFWEDVLTHGRASPYARWFDIDWGAGAESRRRVFLPVLGDRLGRVIERGELQLDYGDGRFRLRYLRQSFPVDPGTLPLVLETGLDQGSGVADADDPDIGELRSIIGELSGLPPRGRADPEAGAERRRRADEALGRLAQLASRSGAVAEHVAKALAAFRGESGGARRLRRLVAAQPYRPAYWRRGAREINYRRFFTLSHLVALRQEDPAVFDATHARVLDWAEAGVLDGLRIDHIDGLLDPLGYLRRLRAALGDRLPDERAAAFPVWVEKILARDESLREEWPVAGTTGYDFLNEVEDVLLEPEGFAAIEAAYRGMFRRPRSFEAVAARSKRRVLDGPLAADVRRLARALRALATGEDGAGGPGRDGGPLPSVDRLATALRETIAALPVYRTYVDGRPSHIQEPDRVVLEGALATARDRGRADVGALEIVEGVLLPSGPDAPTEGERRRRIAWIQRFQQVSGPAAAKGVEDTAFYIYVPLVSRNEVGGEPDAPIPGAVARLHESNRVRAERWPRAMSCASTHDTKRSADVRARLDVLSQAPELWGRHVARWHRWNREHRRRLPGGWAPDRNAEYLLYQTLVGIWNPAIDPGDEGGLERTTDAIPHPAPELLQRVEACMEKSVREAKVRTSWVAPDADYEAALRDFVRAILDPARSERFLRDLDDLIVRIVRVAHWSSAARTLLQIAAPGVPDIYQGDELPTFALVDPDNRRPVDFDLRRARLAALAGLTDTAGAEPEALVDPDVGHAAALRDLTARPEDGRLKLLVVHRGLGCRRRAPGLFAGGAYAPLIVEGSAADRVVAFVRRDGDRAALALAARPTLSVAPTPGQPPVGAVWSGTVVALSDDIASRTWRCALSGASVRAEGPPRAARLHLADAFAHLPVALLVSGVDSGLPAAE